MNRVRMIAEVQSQSMLDAFEGEAPLGDAVAVGDEWIAAGLPNQSIGQRLVWRLTHERHILMPETRDGAPDGWRQIELQCTAPERDDQDNLLRSSVGRGGRGRSRCGLALESA